MRVRTRLHETRDSTAKHKIFRTGFAARPRPRAHIMCIDNKREPGVKREEIEYVKIEKKKKKINNH